MVARNVDFISDTLPMVKAPPGKAVVAVSVMDAVGAARDSRAFASYSPGNPPPCAEPEKQEFEGVLVARGQNRQQTVNMPVPIKVYVSL